MMASFSLSSKSSSEFNSGDDKIYSYKRHDKSVHLLWDAAIMTYRYQTEETYKGHDVGGDERMTRISAKRDGRWVMFGAQDTRVNALPAFTSLTSDNEVTLSQGKEG